MEQDGSGLMSDWKQHLSELETASSRGTAGISATYLIDEVIPGGSVVMDGGSEVVEALSAVNDLRTHPYRAYVVWSLGSIAEWARIWHDVAQVSPSPSIPERFRCERGRQLHWHRRR